MYNLKSSMNISKPIIYLSFAWVLVCLVIGVVLLSNTPRFQQTEKTVSTQQATPSGESNQQVETKVNVVEPPITTVETKTYIKKK